MTTQIIRNTEGVIVTGKFCQIGSLRPQSKINCDNAGETFIYTLAMNPAHNDQFEQAVQSIIVTIDGVKGDISMINPDNGLDQRESTDQEYSVPPNFVPTTPSVLLVVTNNNSTTKRFKIFVPEQYRNVLAIVVPDQLNPTLNTGDGFAELCLAPVPIIPIPNSVPVPY